LKNTFLFLAEPATHTVIYHCAFHLYSCFLIIVKLKHQKGKNVPENRKEFSPTQNFLFKLEIDFYSTLK